MNKTKCGACSVSFQYPAKRDGQAVSCPKCAARIVLAPTLSTPEISPTEAELQRLRDEVQQLKQATAQTAPASNAGPKAGQVWKFRENQSAMRLIGAILNGICIPGVGHMVQGRILEGIVWLVLILGTASVWQIGLELENMFLSLVGIVTVALWIGSIVGAALYRGR